MNETALATVPQSPPAQLSAFSSIESFEAAQRMAKLLCASTIVPQSYRDNLGDAVIALEMANRIQANVLSVMQNLYIVHGKPAWSSQFLIACVNASGKFSPLRYEFSGDGDDYGCRAWAVDKSGEKLFGSKVTIGMAKSEGWTTKNGSKWKSFPDQMLIYRAATFFARAYAPELTMGIQTQEEIIDIATVVTDPVKSAKPAKVFQFQEPVATPEPPATAPEAPPVVKPGPADILTGALSEIEGATFDDLREWAQVQFPTADFSAIGSVAEMLPLAVSELSKPAKVKSLKVWLRAAVEQRKAKA